MSIKVGISTYEPAVSHATQKTSAGGGMWLDRLINHLRYSNMEPVWVENHRAPAFTGGLVMDTSKALRYCDVFLMPWRWRMDEQYEDRNRKRDEQEQLLDGLKRTQVAIIHDEDHKMTATEIDELYGRPNVCLTSPELLPREGFETLHFPYPFSGLPTVDDLSIQYENAMLARPTVGYIGNNYERFEQTFNFYSSRAGLPSDLVVKIWGNWLEPNPEREEPNYVLHKFPNVEFMGRLPQSQVLQQLSTLHGTIALHKPSYGPTGFMTIRWAEAIASMSPLFIPSSFQMSRTMHAIFAADGMVVEDAKDFANKVRDLYESEGMFIGRMLRQQQVVYQLMDERAWTNKIREELKHNA